MLNEPDYNLWFLMKKEFEGFRTRAYKDSGSVWTIGFGSTYNHTFKRRVQQGDLISQEIAIEWMKIDAIEVVRQLNFYIKVKLKDTQTTAICDYIYNRGIGNFLKTQLDELINSNANIDDICKEIERTGLWDKIGNMLNGLIRRRKSESYLYKNGVLKFYF